MYTVFFAVLGPYSEASPTNGKYDLLILERDSLLAIYGDLVEAKEFDCLRVFDHGISGKINI